jgi:hypothetical protein
MRLLVRGKRIRLQARARDFLFSKASRIVDMGPNQFPVQWVQGIVSPVVKRPRREDDHSLSIA